MNGKDCLYRLESFVLLSQCRESKEGKQLHKLLQVHRAFLSIDRSAGWLRVRHALRLCQELNVAEKNLLEQFSKKAVQATLVRLLPGQVSRLPAQSLSAPDKESGEVIHESLQRRPLGNYRFAQISVLRPVSALAEERPRLTFNGASDTASPQGFMREPNVVRDALEEVMS